MTEHETQSKKLSVDQIQETILRRISFVDYKPGDQLKEAVLAKEFGVSRTPVRDALSRISHLGLVETRNGVGTVVVELTDEEIRHLYEIRLHLASMIGFLSPISITDGHRTEAREIYDLAVNLNQEFNSREFVRLNQRLQNLVSSLIGNSLLKEFWQQAYYQAVSIWHRMAESFGADISEAMVLELKDMLEALERDDIEAVGHVQRIHIGYAYRLIQKNLFGED